MATTPRPPSGGAAGSRSAATDGRRAELLGIAAAVFARSGYAAANLREIADAAGILTGSLYHHFPSKESIAVALVSRLHDDLAALAAAPVHPGGDALDDVLAFADRFATLAQDHRAAIHMSVFAAPSRATSELSRLVGGRPAALDRRWAQALGAARDAGRLRPDLDADALGELLSAASYALASNPRTERLRELVTALTALLLHGLARTPPDPAGLDASTPLRTARDIVREWPRSAADGGRREEIVAAARAEFARRGYRATTIRDIGLAAGIQSNVLYRHFRSKDAILDAIVGEFSGRLLAAQQAVVAAPGTPTARLDALLSLMASVESRSWQEFAIVKDWWQTLGPVGAEEPPPDNAARLRLLERLLEQGVRDGEFRATDDPGLRAVAVRAALWVSLREPGDVAARRRHALLRSCVLAGAAVAGHGDRSIIYTLDSH